MTDFGSETVYQFLYVSHARHRMDEAEIGGILAKSRLNNKRNSITGVLLFDDKVFVQLLEGDERKVAATVEKIRTDPRHEGILCLLAQESPDGRVFGNWTMGFLHLHLGAAAVVSPREVPNLAELTGQLQPKLHLAAGRILHDILTLNPVPQRFRQSADVLS